MSIKTKQGLQSKLDEIAREALEKLAHEVKAAWRNYIQTKYYDQYEPSRYKRTWQLLNSLAVTKVYKSQGRWVIDVFMDDSDVFYKSGDYYTTEEIWEMAADGIHGRPEITQTEGRFYEAILNDLKTGVFHREFEKILKGMGLKITKR